MKLQPALLAVVLITGVIEAGGCSRDRTPPAASSTTRDAAANHQKPADSAPALPPQAAVSAAPPIAFRPKDKSNGKKIEGMGQQWFYYDPKTRTASTPDGPTMKSSGSIVPIRILSFSFGSGGATMSYFYKDVLIDLTDIQGWESFPFGIAQVNDDQQIISIAVKGHKNLLIDDNYNVFADDSRITSAGAPSVMINILATRSVGKKYEPVSAVRGFLERDGGQKTAFETGADGKAAIAVDSAAETAIVCVATDGSGERIEATVPLPMKGAAKGLVTQTVILEFGTKK